MLAYAKHKQRNRPRSVSVSTKDPTDLEDAGWHTWATTLFGSYVSKGFSTAHKAAWDWAWAIEEGKPDPLVVVAGRGSGKCQSIDTPILTLDGVKPIQDVRMGDFVLSHNFVTGANEYKQVTKLWDAGVKPSYTIVTKTGRFIRVSQDHKIYTYRGWVAAKDLLLTDRIASTRKIPLQATNLNVRDEEVSLLGYLLADGALSSRSIGYTKNDQLLVTHVKDCAAKLGFSLVLRSKVKGNNGQYRLNGSHDWLRSWGLYGSKSTTKKLPASLFNLPEQQIWLLLSSLFDSDGWVSSNTLCLAFSNQNLIEDVRRLLLQVGVLSTVRCKKTTHMDSYELCVDQECLYTCLKCMSLIRLEDKLKSVCAKDMYSLIDLYPSSIWDKLQDVKQYFSRNYGFAFKRKYCVTRKKLQRFIGIYPHPHYLHLENADIFYDKIMCITPTDAVPMYDLEVKDNHNYFADYLLTHNSTTAELITVAIGATQRRRYGWYISLTQDLADSHVASIAGMLEEPVFGQHYPAMAARAVTKYGHSRGWRRNRLRCSNGFLLDSRGLEIGSRGVKDGAIRPDFMIFDDIDDTTDTERTTKRKLSIIKKSILPAGAPNCALYFIQNLILENGLFAQLLSGEADFLQRSRTIGPLPAIENMTYDVLRNEVTNKSFVKITGGTPVWQGQDLATCQAQIDEWGLSTFLEEAQHEVQEPDGQMFTPVEYTYCTLADCPAFSRVCVAVDPAVSNTDQSDCQAIQVDGYDPASDQIYRLHSSEQRRTPVDTIRYALLRCVDYNANVLVIEVNQGGDTWTSVVKEAWDSLKSEKRVDKNRRLPTIKHRHIDKSDGSKIRRANKMLSDYMMGKFTHVEGTHHVLEKALRRFPAKKPFDLVDSAFLSWDELSGTGKGKTVVIGV